MPAKVHQVRAEVGTRERAALIAEADRQTRAIMRLEVYKRLGYSAVAMGALIVYGRTSLEGAGWLLPLGVAIIALSGVASVTLAVGIARAKKNVHAIMAAAGVDLDAVPLSGPHRRSRAADAVRWANGKADEFITRHSDDSEP